MRISYIFNALGLICKYVGIVIAVPILVALYYNDIYSIKPFLTASVVSIILGFVLNNKNIKNDYLNDLKKSEGLLIVLLSWVTFAMISSIPYYFYGFDFINATFEAVSSATTTGSTVLTHYDYPKTMFFWRSFCQWLGGMGIIVLFIAILPQFKVAGRQMFFAEAPGPGEDKITPRIRNTATALWAIYVIFTIVEIVFLKFSGMSLFHAFCTSFSTLSSGGLSPNPQSIQGYNNLAIVWIVGLFLFFTSLNFSLLYSVWTKKKPGLFLKNEEFKLYVKILVSLIVLIILSLVFIDKFSFCEAFTHGLFQVVSFQSGGGFSSIDYTKFNDFAKVILLIAMAMGACAGSTCGGIKIVRFLLIFKYINTEIKKIIHPNAVYPIRINNQMVPKDVMTQIITFVCFYAMVLIISILLVMVIEGDVTVATTGVLSAINNVGIAFGLIGPTGSFETLHGATKMILAANMLIGRLEVIPFIALFSKDFWKFKNY